MIIISFPPPAKPLNLNQKYHWAVKAKLVAVWRQAARIAALDAINRSDIEPNQPFSIVQLSIPVRSMNIRRDPSNWSATTKPVVDGLVDACLFADDDSTRVATLEPRFHAQRDDQLVSVLIRAAATGGVL